MHRLLILTCCICVINASRVHKVYPRMVYGAEIEIEDAPYQVSIIKLLNETHGNLYCGGSILSKYLILTAAHCAKFEPKKYIVGSGSTTAAKSGKLHEVVTIIRHKDFEIDLFGKYSHDIAIMKVEPGFVLDGMTEEIVTLADRDDEVKAGDHAFITGWGKTANNRFSKNLKGVSLKIVDFKKCIEDYEHLGVMTKYNICAQHRSGTQGVCTGDSGGALIVKGKQVGIVSWGQLDCATPGRSGVYTDVAKYREWIDKHMNI